MDNFSCDVVAEEPGSISAAFSVSGLELRFLKLNLGNRFLKDDLPLDDMGPGDPFPLGSAELGVKTKFTFFGVGVGVGNDFI